MDDGGLAGQTVEETGSSGRKRGALALPYLFLVLECARPWAGGARHDLAQIDEVWLGRGPERLARRFLVGAVRVLELHIPDVRMSRRHARIVRQSGNFFVEDLGSTNGSRVGGSPVARPAQLSDGDVLEVGRTFLRFRAALATPLGSVADLDSRALQEELLEGFVTLLPALADRHTALARVAGSRVPILLLGETGTGKEVLARSIHAASGRRGRFVAVNCGAIPATLVEAQLFGHTRGAFSGAMRDEPGFVRSAHEGTLFLDEIGDLARPAQAALLRVLQEGEVVPVGSSRPERVGVRVVCATHRDLHTDVARGAFRADLFARFAGFLHTLPPLRERMEDLGHLVAVILSRRSSEDPTARTFTLQAARKLVQHDWPLNVRELELSLSVATALAGATPIDVDHMPKSDGRRGVKAAQEPQLDEALRARLIEELRFAGGNITTVARTMGKARMQVQRWIKRYNIDPKTFRVQ